MSERFDATVRRAIAEGLLPESAVRPETNERPWPVVLLTSLGAWLAAVPLLLMIWLLLGDLISRGIGPYVISILLLGMALVILRAREVALFLEQLAVPVLLTGGGSLAFGLFRDLPDRSATALLAAVALTLAFIIDRAWLRVLLGALSAALVASAVVPSRVSGFEEAEALWVSAHCILALWLGSLWIQSGWFAQGNRARHAITIEQVAAGWAIALLAGMAVLSGMTFLVGGALGGFAGELAREPSRNIGFDWQSAVIPAASVALALAAGAVAGRAWPSLRQTTVVGTGMGLAVLAWFLPLLGAVLLVLAITATSHRYRLAGAAALAAAWIVGSFYYQLHWPLMTKALVLMGVGTVLGLLGWISFRQGSPASGGTPQVAPPDGRRWPIALAAALTLLAVNIGIMQKEKLIAEGQPVFVRLAPVDPRSLMQGDYMRLNFQLPGDIGDILDDLVAAERPKVVARRDERGVVTLLRLHDEAHPLGNDEFLIELTPSDGRWILVTDAWFFREGDGGRWAEARFGEFRVDETGKALLVGMVDAELRPIAP